MLKCVLLLLALATTHFVSRDGRPSSHAQCDFFLNCEQCLDRNCYFIVFHADFPFCAPTYDGFKGKALAILTPGAQGACWRQPTPRQQPTPFPLPEKSSSTPGTEMPTSSVTPPPPIPEDPSQLTSRPPTTLPSLPPTHSPSPPPEHDPFTSWWIWLLCSVVVIIILALTWFVMHVRRRFGRVTNYRDYLQVLQNIRIPQTLWIPRVRRQVVNRPAPPSRSGSTAPVVPPRQQPFVGDLPAQAPSPRLNAYALDLPAPRGLEAVFARLNQLRVNGAGSSLNAATQAGVQPSSSQNDIFLDTFTSPPSPSSSASQQSRRSGRQIPLPPAPQQPSSSTSQQTRRSARNVPQNQDTQPATQPRRSRRIQERRERNERETQH